MEWAFKGIGWVFIMDIEPDHGLEVSPRGTSCSSELGSLSRALHLHALIVLRAEADPCFVARLLRFILVLVATRQIEGIWD